MNYKLIEDGMNNIYDIQNTVLQNRGIEDINKYLNVTDKDIHDYNLLDNIQDAVQCLLKHTENKSNIHIVVDADTDGYTSASIAYQYIKLLEPEINLTYSIHTKKQHGLSDDIVIPDNTHLIILPDAGTNDIKQCAEYKSKGIDIIILDHHISDIENPHAIIVNNQIDNYPNKNLSGVGVTYKFLKALDDETWNDYADGFLDLVALGIIADVMDIREYENKRIINKGLSKIRNKLFQALITKQEYSIKNKVTINNIQFYIVPLINSMIRVGTQEEKELMFKAFIQQNKMFKYKKRGETQEIDETIYDRVARFCVNTKSKQNKMRDKGIIDISKFIEYNKLDGNKVIFANATNVIDNSMTGIVAINIAEKYNKPCLLLHKTEDGKFGGSGRNIDGISICSLKEILQETELFEFVQGHDNAFGVMIVKDNIPLVIEKLNEKLKDEDFTHTYQVDFIIDVEDLDVGMFKEFDNLKYLYGQGIAESLVLIENIHLTKQDINIIGKNKNTLKFVINDEFEFIKFRLKDDDKIVTWLNDDWANDKINVNVIGKFGFNNYKGILKPQVIIEGYQIIEGD